MYQSAPTLTCFQQKVQFLICDKEDILRKTIIMKATLTFVIDPHNDSRVLLAIKQKKIGEGKWNGYGGKPEPQDLSLCHTAVRELFEESGEGIVVDPQDLDPCAIIDFYFQDNTTKEPNWSVVIYTTTKFSGTASSTDEAKDPTWFLQHEIDYNNMLPADRQFIPKVLAGEVFTGIVRFNHDKSGVEFSQYYPITKDSLDV